MPPLNTPVGFVWPSIEPGEPPLLTDDGNEPLLRRGEREQRLARMPVARVKVFDLSVEDDAAEYARIMGFVALGWFEISREEIQFVEAIANWKIFLRWLEIYQVNSSSLPSRITTNVHGQPVHSNRPPTAEPASGGKDSSD